MYQNNLVTDSAVINQLYDVEIILHGGKTAVLYVHNRRHAIKGVQRAKARGSYDPQQMVAPSSIIVKKYRTFRPFIFIYRIWLI